MGAPAWFERIGPGDAQALATDVGPVPANVGALLVLDTPTGFDVDALVAVLASRTRSVPRMRQCLKEAPPGCGRPIWVDHPSMDPHQHIDVIGCPPPGDDRALLAMAVDAVTRPLDRARPLWRARIITGLAGNRVAVVLTLHHVLADGIGGLAVLAGLVDGAGAGPGELGAPPGPRPGPTPGMLFTDATRSRVRALRRTGHAVAALGPALRELGTDRPGRAPCCSLNQPTGPRRAAAVVSVPLDPLLRLARDNAATLNDVLLVAVARALESVLAGRGERVPALVISVPVAARAGTTTDRLGNQVGVMPVRVPLGRSAAQTLVDVASHTAARRTAQRGSSAALVTPAFRLLAALHLFGPLIERQRLVNSFLTNMRGPEQPMALAGAPIRLVAPLTITTGNVSAAFAALSYAGTLSVVVITDPDLVSERDGLVDALHGELASAAAPTPAGGWPGQGSSSG